MTDHLDFRQTWLWRQAFETPRQDTSTAEQEFFRNQYTAMREKATQLVSRISTDLPGMTVHDISHLDALWGTASLVSEGAISLNPAEAFVFGASVLLHDAGMSLAAFPNGLEDVKRTTIWLDTVARHISERKKDGETPVEPKNLPLETVNQILPDVLRRLHAEQAECLAEQSWEVEGTRFHLINDPDLRAFYGPTIGQIAHSHWWPVSKLETELNGDLGAFPQQTRHLVDRIKLACLLRIADALHIDSKRAPKFLRAITKPNGVSALHWAFQERLAAPHIELDTIVFTTGQPFDQASAEAWWLAFDTISLIDRELIDVDQLLRSRDREVLRARGVKGAGSPETLARTLKTKDWRPVDARLKISDVPHIVETLGGSKLYGDDPTVPLRELIQNAADAVQARRHFEDRGSDWGKIVVGMEKREDGFWLTVEDNGIGMSELVLTGPLLDFGTSFWRSSLAMEEFPGLMASGMEAIGRFGIGFFSVFMLGSSVRVFSRRCDKGADLGRLLEFRSGTSMRPILSQPPYRSLPKDGGTRVEVRLHVDPSARNGLLHSSYNRRAPLSLAGLIGALAPNLDVALAVKTAEGERLITRPGDWLEIAEEQLAGRLALLEKREVPKANLMRVLKTESGTIVGRATILPEPEFRFGDPNGWVTVAGLRATRMKNVAGVLLGEAMTAARNTAIPLIDREGLAEWASEQAQLICQHVKDEEKQAQAAEVVLTCGGDIGHLKIIRYGDDWLDQFEFSRLLSELTEINISLRGDFTYEEDQDDVLPREFRDHFRVAPDVAIVPKHEGTIVSGIGLKWPATEPSPGALTTRLATFVTTMIAKAWGGQILSMTETRVVGDANGMDIERDIEVISAPDDDFEDSSL
ncbi:Chaperone protein HtpG [Agrobacterium fabrum]|uniref:HD domain-containing protein n=1 Tax=Agrobacterium fabrum TaxID=1176649 RepID=UPI001DAFD0E3|nr:ATP-binding protein [Agrobacterium fabrum]CAH0283567.1 Chaperone protein HtpG [Agrobacterium fabrum]CAH0297270.1 Chaperone protein HtpG [Agrobacterium fabrum]